MNVDFYFRNGPVPYTGRRGKFHKYFRQPKTAQERKKASDPEIIPFIRASRHPVHLWFTWDDFRRNIQRSWKKQYKIKRQWMIHQKKKKVKI